MNPRHTAALALVGWYLMTPPIAKDFQSVELPNMPANARSAVSTAHRMSQCIATDDPRLKEK